MIKSNRRQMETMASSTMEQSIFGSYSDGLRKILLPKIVEYYSENHGAEATVSDLAKLLKLPAPSVRGPTGPPHSTVAGKTGKISRVSKFKHQCTWIFAKDGRQCDKEACADNGYVYCKTCAKKQGAIKHLQELMASDESLQKPSPNFSKIGTKGKTAPKSKDPVLGKHWAQNDDYYVEKINKFLFRVEEKINSITGTAVKTKVVYGKILDEKDMETGPCFITSEEYRIATGLKMSVRYSALDPDDYPTGVKKAPPEDDEDNVLAETDDEVEEEPVKVKAKDKDGNKILPPVKFPTKVQKPLHPLPDALTAPKTKGSTKPLPDVLKNKSVSTKSKEPVVEEIKETPEDSDELLAPQETEVIGITEESQVSADDDIQQETETDD